jgi:hypothetical protein
VLSRHTAIEWLFVRIFGIENDKNGSQGAAIVNNSVLSSIYEVFRYFLGRGKFGEHEKIFSMKKGPKDHLPPVSMKFSLIASSGTRIQQLAELRLPWGSHHK